MGMIVGCVTWQPCHFIDAPHLGEILEKSTRVLTPEERELLDKDWVGKNGTKRKMEVG
jgi:hypothetical protein